MARRTRRRSVTLTNSCRKLVLELEGDLRLTIDEEVELAASLKAEWKEAKDQNRTGKTLDSWTGDLVTQVAASWVLSCVFVRFVEDNGLIDQPLLSGPTSDDPAQSGLRRARDTEQAYYREHPDHAEREYLKHVFGKMAALPGMADLFDQRHALFCRMTPRIEGGRRLVEFFRALDDETGQVQWLFTDPERQTRFLGDLYQDLSEGARKAYALLQTPVFVEEFILDRTLEPALDTFDLKEFRMIDPTCGSGHFLLGAFERLLDRWRRAEPGGEPRDLVARALGGVHGVDLNPFAVAIARFRLLVAALEACGIRRLADAPAFHLHLAIGDSLLHGRRYNQVSGRFSQFTAEFDLGHLYSYEVEDELRALLGRQYHAVVGNPPYITPKDKALNRAYRDKYGSCHRKYALSVPFLERFVELAVEGERGRPAGFVGQITSNSFMKREFGKKLIEEYFPTWDLTLVVDMSGIDIAGHGTPTVVLFFRNQRPVSDTVRAVFGIRGEPSTTRDPAKGKVWTAILNQIDRPGSVSDFVSVEDKNRDAFHEHPWGIGGGGVGELMERIEESGSETLGALATEIGFLAITGEDGFFVFDVRTLHRLAFESSEVRPFCEGDTIRDWSCLPTSTSLFPYRDAQSSASQRLLRTAWPFRSTLRTRLMFRKTQQERGLAWWEYSILSASKSTPLSIAFAFVATHNHFILDSGGKVFKQSAPVIKLPEDATKDDHFALLAVLNSSLAEFWIQQKCHNKGGPGGGSSKDEKWKDFYERSGTALKALPLIRQDRLLERAREIHDEAERALLLGPDVIIKDGNATLPDLEEAGDAHENQYRRLVFLQEELDWAVLEAFGIIEAPLVAPRGLGIGIQPGQRAFEIVAAREVKAGRLETRWFELTGAALQPHIDSSWPTEYREVVATRMELIETDSAVALIESMGCKRRWERKSWESQLDHALDLELLDLLEERHPGRSTAPLAVTVHRLAELASADERFMQLLRLRTDEEAPNVEHAAARLVGGDAVPFLPALYLKDEGLRKRTDWEVTWGLQRLEDPFLAQQDRLLTEHFGDSPADQRRAREHVACWKTSGKLSKEADLTEREAQVLAALRGAWRAIEIDRVAAVGGETPTVPPKFKSSDFRGTYWRLRGKLDVPKERFIAYPFCSPEGDDSLLVGWAGWDHEQRATALAQVLQERKDQGWTGDRLAPILAGLDQLVPWLKQWHGDLGEEYERFVESEATREGLTLEAVRAWCPPQVSRRRSRPRAAARSEGE